LNLEVIEALATRLSELMKSKGRLFLIGIGGSAANASHAVNDFRKISGIEAYCPTDNVSELTARANDEGWDSIFVDWLKVSNLTPRDMLFILSVGGGDRKSRVSVPIVEAIDFAKSQSVQGACIVGKATGHAASVSDFVVHVSASNPINLTPHSESMQSFVLHLLVSHPLLKASRTKWEQVDFEISN
jgi:D-sedoheptulose 7-phosphate isomerase